MVPVERHGHERLTGDSGAFWEAWEVCAGSRTSTEEEGHEGMGEPFGFGDAQQMRDVCRGWLRSILDLADLNAARRPADPRYPIRPARRPARSRSGSRAVPATISGSDAAISVPRLERSTTLPASTETSVLKPSFSGLCRLS
ncbi:hypothetical protein [Streptomyces sp. KHY 26]|uniref:hypothetical protein n=1 Tax=Streptomyces sp. KHY 26 TaxID=3097359 RepID=UPI00376F4136